MDEIMKGLVEEMGPLSKRMTAITEKLHAERRGLKPEEQAEWDQLNRDYDGLKARYDLAKTAHDKAQLPGAGDGAVGAGLMREGRDRRGNPAAPSEEVRSLAMQAWFVAQVGKEITAEQREACREVGFNPAVRELCVPLLGGGTLQSFRRAQARDPRRFRDAAPEVEARNLSTLAAGAGGALIPPGDLVRSLEVNMLAFGGMRQVADVVRTSTGERIPFPTVDDTGNAGVQLGEGGAIGASKDPTFGLVYLDAYKYSSTPILMPYELIQDSAFNLADLVGEFFGTRLGRITNKKFTNGTGAAEPRGIVTAAAAGVTSTNVGSVIWDDFIGLIHSVDIAYREGGRFMWHDTVTKTLRLLKDSTGRPLWQPLYQASMQDGPADLMGGYEYTTNQDMASTIASGNVVALFGQLSKYKIRSVGQMRMYHLVERYRDNDMDAFIGFIREDGNLLQAGTPPVKKLTVQ